MLRSLLLLRLSDLNVVINDGHAGSLSALSKCGLSSVSLELDDCFGVGLASFLDSVGKGPLQHLSISCSSGQ